MSAESSHSQAARELAIKTSLPENALVLVEFRYSEELGRPFRLEATVIATKPDIKPEKLIGENVTIRLTTGGPSKERHFNGIVCRVSQSADINSHPEYVLTIVPGVWLLTKTSDCRIFQAQTPEEIFKKMFEKVGLASGGTINSVKAKYEFCVQYRETDFNFVHRLMEQEGVSYLFEHGNGKHKLVLTDDTTTAKAMTDAAELEYHPPGQPTTDNKPTISSWHAETEIESSGVMMNDYNFEAPSVSLRTPHSVDFPHLQPKSEIYDYPADTEKPQHLPDYAKVRAEELKSHAESFLGATSCRTLEAGRKFTLKDPKGALRADLRKDYVVVSASCHARQNLFESGGGGGMQYSCDFRAIPATWHYRPARRTPKPMIPGPQTAVVVGPANTEIHTDKYGRVMVQFFWDRYGAANEKSSCWIRVSQLATGKNWGAIFTPRVGEEVVVEFLEGDPDRPLVMGRVYNATNMPPYALPANKTMSGFKSSSSQGGEGFNELRFEDKKGSEQVFIHAEKNMDVRVKNDTFETIGANKHLEVEKDSHIHVKNDLHSLVDRDFVEKVVRDVNRTVEGKEAIEIKKTLSLKVVEDVGEEFKANYSTVVTKDYLLKADNICLDAKTNITLKVGECHIAISSGGIKIGSSADIKIEAASGNLDAKAKAVKIEGSTTADFKSAAVTVDGSTATTIKGGMVNIN